MMLKIRGNECKDIDIHFVLRLSLSRNLFAAMYGGVYKRNGLPSDVLSPEQIQYLKNFVVKRAPRRMNFRGWSGLKDPYDPRFVSLFILTDSLLPGASGQDRATL